MEELNNSNISEKLQEHSSKIESIESDISEIKNILLEIRSACCCKNVDNTLLSMNKILAEIDNAYNLSKVKKTLTDLAAKMPNEEPSPNIKPNGEQKKVIIKSLASYYKDNWIKNIEIEHENKLCPFRNIFTPRNWKNILNSNKNVIDAKSGDDKLKYLCELSWNGINENVKKFDSNTYSEEEKEIVSVAKDRYTKLLNLYDEYKTSQ